jgi:hypothetical protein
MRKNMMTVEVPIMPAKLVQLIAIIALCSSIRL